MTPIFDPKRLQSQRIFNFLVSLGQKLKVLHILKFSRLPVTFGPIYGPKTMKIAFFRKIRGLFRALNRSKVDQISIFWARWNRNGEISLSAKFQLSATSVGRLRALQSQKSKNDVLPWYKTESDFHTEKRRSSEFFFTFSGSIYEARKHGGGPFRKFFVWCPLPPTLAHTHWGG